MAAPFYNPADQAIYEGGEHFIPQEQYRLGPYTPPAIMGQNTNTGLASTGVAAPYKWPYSAEGGGGGSNAYGLDLNRTKTFNKNIWTDTGPFTSGWTKQNITGYYTPSGWKTKEGKNIEHAGMFKTDVNRNYGDIEETEMDFSKLRNLSPVNFITTKLRNWKRKRDITKEQNLQDEIAAHNQAAAFEAKQATTPGYGSAPGGQGFDAGTGRTTTSDYSGRTGQKEMMAQGGRIGYRNGEFVDEDINIEGPGFDVNENMMASDDNNTRILENLFEKYLELGFSPEDAEIKAMEEFELMSQGPEQDQGIASLV